MGIFIFIVMSLCMIGLFFAIRRSGNSGSGSGFSDSNTSMFSITSETTNPPDNPTSNDCSVSSSSDSGNDSSSCSSDSGGSDSGGSSSD